MDNRKRIILKAIVDRYVQSAEPVGSKALSAQPGLDVSPATLRNEMAALEDMGYLEQPHTSAGRIPTALGYRMYVNELMTQHRLSRGDRESIEKLTHFRLTELDRLLNHAGRILADLTHYAAVAATGYTKDIKVQRIELFASEPCALVVVVVLEGGRVESRHIRTAAPLPMQELPLLANLLNKSPDPLNTDDLTIAEHCPLMMHCWHAVKSFFRTLSQGREEVYVAGEAQLLEHPEFHDILRARRTLSYLAQQKSEIFQSLPRQSGVQITIGPENVARELEDASVIMASYPMGEGLRGLIGVVGPTRMDYAKLSSHLGYFAAQLEKLTRPEDE